MLEFGPITGWMMDFHLGWIPTHFGHLLNMGTEQGFLKGKMTGKEVWSTGLAGNPDPASAPVTVL